MKPRSPGKGGRGLGERADPTARLPGVLCSAANFAQEESGDLDNPPILTGRYLTAWVTSK